MENITTVKYYTLGAS